MEIKWILATLYCHLLQPIKSPIITSQKKWMELWHSVHSRAHVIEEGVANMIRTGIEIAARHSNWFEKFEEMPFDNLSLGPWTGKD